MSKPKSFEEYFVPTPGVCWDWLGPRSEWGYGKYRRRYAHRIAMERKHG